MSIEDEDLKVDGVEIIADKPVLERPNDEEEFDSNDPRAAIYAKRDAQLKAEMQAEPVASSVAQAVAVEEENSDEVKVVINGKEKLVSQARIDAAGGIVAYQKQAAASELLNQASAEARRIREQEAQILERERQLSIREQEIQNQSFKTPAPSNDDNEDALLAAKEYHEAILDGDMDKASRLLLQIQAAQSVATVDKNEVANEAVRRARQELDVERSRQEQQQFEIERQEANFDFEARFPLVADDPKLRALANQETIDLQAAHPTWTPKEIITAAAQSVQNWASERLAISSTDQKLAAKRGTSNIRGGSVVAAQRQAPAPQTKSNYVEQLRKARGLE
jgi:hypothetical protein